MNGVTSYAAEREPSSSDRGGWQHILTPDCPASWASPERTV